MSVKPKTTPGEISRQGHVRHPMAVSADFEAGRE
jgi:hypothetical protein